MVKFYGRIADLLGEKEVLLEGVDKLSDVYEKLREKLGDKAKVLFQSDGEPRAGLKCIDY